MNKFLVSAISAIASITCLAGGPSFIVDAGHSTGKVSPKFCGLMTEEINHSYDGGLYAELIHNRAFLDSATAPVHWSVVGDADSAADIVLDPKHPFNDELPTSLRLTVSKATDDHGAGVANSGYWGIPVQPETRYRAAIVARGEPDFTGPLTVSIVSDDGGTVYASERVSGLTAGWKRFDVALTTGKVSPTARAHFAITLNRPGTVWLGFVSLFPPTWNDRPNGLRKDLMQMLVDLHPQFLRFPGGNYVEGDTVDTRFDWKKTIGPIEERPGHACPWGYRSSDGLGLLEFLEWCEDMKAEPVLAVYAGYSLRGIHVNPGQDLEPFVRDALDEIEYVVGNTETTWGARRAKDGHPAPFPLTYVEIGNEDWFDKSGSYDARFAQFYDAIKARFPQLKTISTIGHDQPQGSQVRSRKPDMTDEHYYRSTDEFIRSSPDYARHYDRIGPEIFVGEWAAHEDAGIRPWDAGARKQPPTPTMKAAIGDGVFLAAMERNADLIKMQCYAPLFVNVNSGARQWRPDLIGYNALSSFGSPSYYTIQMFSQNLGDEMLAVLPASTAVQGSATRNSKTGEIIVKLVNPQPTEEKLNVELKGVAALSPRAQAILLSGRLDDLNSLDHPRQIAPVQETIDGVKPQFTFPVPANSIVVLKFNSTS